jgi:uroporphyrinogen-III decarboxylase
VDSYRELFLPYHKKINDWIHANTKWSTFKHSCGAVDLFIPSFIEAGFDILNPVQWTAAGMDRETIKSKYHKRIVFWGGGVDTQRTLPFGTPAEVEKEVLDTCRILGKGGGFVFNTIHNIQAKTPVENVVAMLGAVRKYNKG